MQTRRRTLASVVLATVTILACDIPAHSTESETMSTRVSVPTVDPCGLLGSLFGDFC